MSSPDTAPDDACDVTTTEERPFKFVRKRHDTYHFDMLHLEAEQTLFKIPRMCFEQAQAFWDTFSSPIPDRDQSGTSGQEGSCDDNPIVLEGVKCIDFEHFLDLLIPSLSRSKQPPNLSVQEWLKVLDLADMWGFDVIRESVIEELSQHTIGEIEKVELAHKYQIKDWYVDAYLALALRQWPLTIEESKQIGWETAMKIAWVRERKYSDGLVRTCNCTALSSSYIGGYQVPVTINDLMSGNRLEELVKDIFELRPKPEPRPQAELESESELQYRCVSMGGKKKGKKGIKKRL